MPRLLVPLVAAAAVLVATPALAHTAAGAAGFAAGLSHPFAGADHMLAAITVGLWAAQNGGRAVWVLPVTFVTMMVGGVVIGFAGLTVAGSEILTLLSVVLLGGAVALAARPALVPNALAVGTFALVHGYAHGTEAPAAIGSGEFLFGVLCATAMLHGAGVVGHAAFRRVGTWAVRGSGAVVALAGLGLAAFA